MSGPTVAKISRMMVAIITASLTIRTRCSCRSWVRARKSGTVPITSKTEKRRMNEAKKDERSKANKEPRSKAIPTRSRSPLAGIKNCQAFASRGVCLKYGPGSRWGVARLEKAISWLVYASVLLGIGFLYVLYGTAGIPSFLFPSILVGELIWIVCAVAISRGVKRAPYLALVLAVITLAVSLPQPTHYSFAVTGQIVAFLIFTGGAVLQFALIAAVALFVFRSRRA